MEAPDDKPSDAVALDSLLTDAVAGTRDLDCAGPYDAERTAGGVLLAQRTVRLPHDWSLREAVANPLPVGWHEPIIRWMLTERIGDDNEHRSYLLRQSILVWSVYTTAPWADSARKGAAYGLLMVGLESHGFRPKSSTSGASAVLMSPASDLFESLEEQGGVRALHRLLLQAFEYAGPHPA